MNGKFSLPLAPVLKLGGINEPGLVKSTGMSQQSSPSRWLFPVLAILVILVIAIWLIDFDEVITVLRNADARLLAASFVFLLTGNLLGTVRWRYLLANQSTYQQTLKSDGISFSANYLLHIPASVMRVITLGRISDVSSAQAASSMVVDRLLEQILRITCLLLALVGFARLLISTSALIGNIVGILVGIGIVFWLIRNPETVGEYLTRWLARLPRMGQPRSQRLVTNLVKGFVLAGSPRRFGFALLLSGVVWICYFGFQALCLMALGFDLTAREIAVMSLTVLAVAPPSAPAMPGIYHGVVIAALAVLGLLDVSDLTAYAIASHILQIAAWLPVGIWGLLTTDLRLRDLAASGRAFVSSPGSNTPDNQARQEEQRDRVNESGAPVRSTAGEGEYAWDNQGAGDAVQDMDSSTHGP